MKKKSGFTILELAVTVIIIAVIAVVALPMYKHAILKSRFTVMPMAKAVADAQEIYYLGNNQYALGKEDLDIAPVEAENTQVSLSPAEEDEEYIYVAAHRTDIPNVRYIMYQKNSPKFASNIHCEADANDEDALWLCEKALHGTELTGKGASSIQGDDYKTFLLAGANETGDYFSKACSGSAQKTCSCGGPVTGSCNDETGNWVYENDCPTPDPDESEACPAGYIGSRTRHAVCENGAYVNKWTDNCELACPAHAVCDDNGNVTGCESGYYQEEQTCKQEIACTGEQPLDKRLCQEAGKCGWETRKVSCNYTTGEWVEPDWNTEGCSATPEPVTRNCHDQNANTCGIQTQSYTCSAQGTWELLGFWLGSCKNKPADESIACDSGYTGNKTRSATCKADNSDWEFKGDYNAKACCNNNTKNSVAKVSCQTAAGYGSSYCGTVTYNVTCNAGTSNNGGVWTRTTKASASCSQANSSTSCSGYSNYSSANATRTATCSGNATNGWSWSYGSWNYSACGCSYSNQGYVKRAVSVSTSTCASGYAWETRSASCSGSTWSYGGWTRSSCASVGSDACYAEILVKYTNSYETCGSGTTTSYTYNSSTGKCSTITFNGQPGCDW